MSLLFVYSWRGILAFAGWPRVWCTHVCQGAFQATAMPCLEDLMQSCVWDDVSRFQVCDFHCQRLIINLRLLAEKPKHPINQLVWSKFFICLFIWIFPPTPWSVALTKVSYLGVYIQNFCWYSLNLPVPSLFYVLPCLVTLPSTFFLLFKSGKLF